VEQIIGKGKDYRGRSVGNHCRRMMIPDTDRKKDTPSDGWVLVVNHLTDRSILMDSRELVEGNRKETETWKV
jgi:hypothetical protein